MDDWGEEWCVDDPAEIVLMLQAILADGRRSYAEKLEALTMLANLADDDAVNVLRWYAGSPDPGLEVVAQLALIEANGQFLEMPPPWDETTDETINLIVQATDELYELLGPDASHDLWCRELAGRLRAAGLTVHTKARALLKYGGQLVEMVPIDLIVNGSVMVDIWTEQDELNFLSESDEHYDALDLFFARLRTANLPVGIHLDVVGPIPTWEIIENSELHLPLARVEHILAIPTQQDDNTSSEGQ
ncbi:MAG: GxxExxY protein [Ardenticatenia bacterium]|nr:GxxExxY protein [Ardenticatenia bacterium]